LTIVTGSMLFLLPNKQHQSSKKTDAHKKITNSNSETFMKKLNNNDIKLKVQNTNNIRFQYFVTNSMSALHCFHSYKRSNIQHAKRSLFKRLASKTSRTRVLTELQACSV